MDVNAKKQNGALFGYWKRRNGAHPAAALLADLAAAVTVYLLSGTHLLFGAYPLGIAALASLRGANLLAGLLGALLSALGMGRIGYIYAAMAIITVCMRLVISIPGKGRRFLPDSAGVFREMPQLRAAVACIVGFAAALYQLLVAGPTTSTLLFGATMLIAPTVGALVFSGLTDAGLSVEELLGKGGTTAERGRGEVLRLSLGALAFGFFLVVSLGGYSLMGISLAYLLAGGLTLYVSRRFGALRGAVTGLLITLGASPLYAPSFALLGLLSGALWELGSFYALALSVASGAAWASYIGRLSGFLAVVPELAIAAMLASPFLVGLGSTETVEKDRARAEAGQRAVSRVTQELDRGSAVSSLENALSELSGELRALFASIREPDLSEYMHAVSCAMAPHCSVCPRRLACAGRDAAERAIAERLMGGEAPEVCCLEESFVRDCGAVGVILSDARGAAADLRASRGADRAVSALSLDYELLSALVSEAAERDISDRKGDEELALAVRQALSERGIETEAAAVCGGRRCKIVIGGARMAGASVSEDELHRTLEELVGARLAPLTLTEEEDGVTLCTEAIRRFSAETCRAYRSARSGETSGDTVSFFEGRDGLFYALLSDGMGSGRRAAFSSGIAALLLRRLLGAGCSKTTALKILNNLLRTSGEESSATVDLMELDLMSGRATFIKSGAAPSYVKRGDNLFRIRSKTVSVGLTEQLDAEKIRFEAEPGDLIVMLSDGVSQSPDDAPWLMEILAGELEGDLSAVAERIVGVAAGTHERKDDMTVALVRVSEAGVEQAAYRAQKPSADEAPCGESLAAAI